MFHDALIRARLSFETQSHPAGDRWEADIELKQAPVIIEVTNSPGESRRADRYRRKTKALWAAGYRVYWFSNHQAQTCPDECVAKVMADNGLQPESRPTVLVRANRIGHEGPLNPNWGGGPKPYTCEYCGDQFSAGMRNGGKPARFCCSECYWDWMNEHPGELNTHLRLDRDWSDLGRLYTSGMTRRQLAEHYQCSETAISNAMRRHGIAFRQRGGSRPRS
jgi:very-short-patch-repair endonuclease